ncbi:hypothetical protein C5L25_000209 [Secundilactobacillus silagei JCM 19001]|uniref:Uncharacterized protein n=1 Tax=Secundilactobacillus silagei JCM 19001 TaxID=1302250 RepID=A0A1Z5IHT1_9LACO|nr:hypothetical protein C5L25_000209 [Secundilactobacillus silagei JCM 19001]GAX01001.1 hypothetical protein IWT126_01023 [Secundilactobacillus silagei JCM 19001]
MKQILVELFVLLLTILLFLFGMNQFHQPSKSRSALPSNIQINVYSRVHINSI